MISRSVRIGSLLALATMGLASTASAHSGRGLAVAEMTRPASVGEVIDEAYLFTWIDGDDDTSSMFATIDFYYTAKNPPTFALGEVPKELEGELIVSGIPVHGGDNAYPWNAREVPTGTYWIYSVLRDPASSNPQQKNIFFSPGVVTVVHSGDEVPPAVVFISPDNPFRWPATEELDIGYRAFDPDVTGRVHIYASREKDGSNMELVHSDLPVGLNGHVLWDTRGLEEGEWTLKAEIVDNRGLSFQAYDRYFRFVNLPGEGEGEGCSAVSIRREVNLFDAALFLSMIGALTYRARRRAGRTVHR